MPTLIFCCGAECGLKGTVGQLHWNGGVNATFSTTTVRTGARSFRVNIAASQDNWESLSVGTQTVFVSRFYIRFATLPNADIALFAPSVSGLSFPGLWFKQSDSKLYCGETSGADTFGATGFSVTTATWYRCDVKVNVSANPWTIDAQIDGTALGQLTVATAASSATSLLMGCLSNNSTTDVFFDDVNLSVTSGDYPLGAGHVYAYVPTSDGTHNVAGVADFRRTLTATDILNTTTDAYLLVDTVPFIATDITADSCVSLVAPPNASDYVQCVFGPAPSSSAANETINGVEVLGALQTASAGGSPTMDLSLRINDGGTTGDVFTSSVFYQPSSPTFRRAHFAVAPSTGTAWTAAKVNALQVRFGSFDAVDSAPDGYFGTVMAEVDEIDAVAGADQEPALIGGKLVRNSLLLRHMVH